MSTMLYSMEISQETADRISIAVLKTSLEGLRTDIANLEIRPQLQVYEQEDLTDFKQLEQAFITVLKYYTSQDEWHLI